MSRGLRWHDIGSVEELERAGHVLARVGNREIGVVLGSDGAPRAVRNRCPHHGAPLCLGRVLERIGGAPGRYVLSGDAVLRCPWHGWEFDLETGRCLAEPSMRVAVYPAKLKGGRVLVQA
jgi:3-phenylpropionate/trans-cinnamate dioxygenase ferredoxin subunit